MKTVFVWSVLNFFKWFKDIILVVQPEVWVEQIVVAMEWVKSFFKKDFIWKLDS